jgi:PTS system mannose-specific IIB component
MGKLVLTRVDDRLIHGQVMTSWVKKTDANKIIIVDDEVANDDFMVELLQMSAPDGIDICVSNIEKSVDLINNLAKEDSRAIVLVKTPITIKRMTDIGATINELIVGGMGTNEKREVLYKNISASQEEKRIFKELIHDGMEIYIHIIPDQKKIDLRKYLD